MTDVDPYVAPPAEPAPTPRLQSLRPWLVLAVVLLLLGAWTGGQLVTAREDPTLQFPGAPSTPPVTAPTPPVTGPTITPPPGQ